MSITARTSALVLASAVAGLTAVAPAHSSDDWETPIAGAAADDEDIDCSDDQEALGVEPTDGAEPRDELTVLEELVTEMRCFTTNATWPRNCGTPK